IWEHSTREVPAAESAVYLDNFAVRKRCGSRHNRRGAAEGDGDACRPVLQGECRGTQRVYCSTQLVPEEIGGEELDAARVNGSGGVAQPVDLNDARPI